MKIEIHIFNSIRIAEVVSNELLIRSAEDGLDVLGDIYYQDFDKLILHLHQLTPKFFDLKNGMAGEILQKFSNYRVRLAIVGDFSSYTSQSIQDFMRESNRNRQINFVGSVEEALEKLT